MDPSIYEKMRCDCCKAETETLFLVNVPGIGQKEVCPKCYDKMYPNDTLQIIK